MTNVIVRVLFGIVLVLTVLSAACSSKPPPPPPPPGGAPPAAEARSLPADCSSTNTTPEQAQAALLRVRPGDVLCLTGAGLAAAELQLAISGTSAQPITIAADGAVISTLTVDADHVIVDGLSVFHGAGITLTGRGLLVRNNVVYNAAENGIVCEQCTDSIIETNVVQRADGTGIILAGERITVRDNLISESVLLTQGDADGIRFFGVGHRLTGNTIRDIKASGHEDDPRGGPHTDCFQTYDTARDPLTYDVIISDNVCTNVDVQCLIASAEEALQRSARAGRTAITFERNICQVNGSQGVLLQNFPNVIVRDNTFSGPRHRAVMIMWGSTDTVVADNIVDDGLIPYEVDERSRFGFNASGNVAR